MHQVVESNGAKLHHNGVRGVSHGLCASYSPLFLQQFICLVCEPHGINLLHQQTIVV
jgi:hypothetical protein